MTVFLKVILSEFGLKSTMEMKMCGHKEMKLMRSTVGQQKVICDLKVKEMWRKHKTGLVVSHSDALHWKSVMTLFQSLKEERTFYLV